MRTNLHRTDFDEWNKRQMIHAIITGSELALSLGTALITGNVAYAVAIIPAIASLNGIEHYGDFKDAIRNQHTGLAVDYMISLLRDEFQVSDGENLHTAFSILEREIIQHSLTADKLVGALTQQNNSNEKNKDRISVEVIAANIIRSEWAGHIPTEFLPVVDEVINALDMIFEQLPYANTVQVIARLNGKGIPENEAAPWYQAGKQFINATDLPSTIDRVVLESADQVVRIRRLHRDAQKPGSGSGGGVG